MAPFQFTVLKVFNWHDWCYTLIDTYGLYFLCTQNKINLISQNFVFLRLWPLLLNFATLWRVQLPMSTRAPLWLQLAHCYMLVSCMLVWRCHFFIFQKHVLPGIYTDFIVKVDLNIPKLSSQICGENIYNVHLERRTWRQSRSVGNRAAATLLCQREDSLRTARFLLGDGWLFVTFWAVHLTAWCWLLDRQRETETLIKWRRVFYTLTLDTTCEVGGTNCVKGGSIKDPFST